jgi:hypothetical protein
MIKPLLIVLACFASASLNVTGQAAVRVEPSNLQGSRPLSEQTSKAVIRDYLESWQSLTSALEENRSDLLDPAFVGSARDNLATTIQQQTALGIKTHYQDLAHDIQIVFYSPEGLSVELTDMVDYDVQIQDHGKVKTTQHVTTRYLIVVTPAEVRWRVRVFQAAP